MAHEVTQVLLELTAGDPKAMERLVPLVYDQLHMVASNLLDKESPDHTLQPTALVHEAYLRLIDQQQVGWNGRTHFFAAASQAMRRVLVDHARRRNAEKRGGKREQLSLDTGLLVTYESAAGGADLLDLDAALHKLAEINPMTVRVVEMRYFGGMTIDETAAVLGVSATTVEREWRFARAWLRDALSSGECPRS